MKNLYLTLCSVVLTGLSFAQNGQIMNGGFENWSNTTIYDYLTQWGNSNSNDWKGVPTAVQSTDAQSGTYSVELRGELIPPVGDTAQGYVYHGTVGQMGPSGGIAYTSPFDEVKFWYKSDLPVGDTAYLLYIRFIASTPVEMNILPAVTGMNGTWTQGSVSVPAGTQDELFIGFMIGDPVNGVMPTPGAWVRIDNVEMYNLSTATTAVPDPSFEQWASQSVETPDNWFTLNEVLVGSGLENGNKTTDANSGTYAIELSTVQNTQNGDTIPGFLSIGPFNFNGMNPFMPAPYNASPTTFSGAYKYSPSGSDGGNIQIVFLQGGSPIGNHFETFTSQANYTTFSSTLTVGGTPDSIIFVAFSGDNPGSVLKLDDLQFSGGNVGLNEFADMNVNIYPNPANDYVFVKAEGEYELTIVDLMGKEVYTSTNNTGAQQIDLTKFESGNYLIYIKNQTTVETHRLSVQ